MLRKQKAATNVQARLECAEVYRDANPVCRCFRQPAEYTAGWGCVQTNGLMQRNQPLTDQMDRFTPILSIARSFGPMPS
ncbi:hypothetical protein [Ralstonia mojiangensis]|uniref:hypothetical protein n=1 Tax=Ralstonia mojiangensis TaxID=2953895 RepID=UPI0020913FBC|nr:hypothetical protein [Ralstonia mojiangensis]